MDKVILEIIRSKEEILKALTQSKVSGTVIGINSKALGLGTCMTSVVDLITEEKSQQVIVVLKAYDMTGYFLDRSCIALHDIDSVIPFTALFENPFLRDLNRELDGENSLKAKLR